MTEGILAKWRDGAMHLAVWCKDQGELGGLQWCVQLAGAAATQCQRCNALGKQGPGHNNAEPTIVDQRSTGFAVFLLVLL